MPVSSFRQRSEENTELTRPQAWSEPAGTGGTAGKEGVTRQVGPQCIPEHPP